MPSARRFGLLGGENLARARELAQWQRRLAQSLKDLQDSEQAGCTITEIAFRWGFSNAAHFSHAFKQAYGLSPRECRVAARC